MSDTGAPAAGGRRGPVARLLRVLITLLLLLAAGVALLPNILSTAFFRNTALDEANRVLGGTVELDGLSLSWFGTQELTGLRLWPARPGEGEPLLVLPEASFRAPMLALATGRPHVTAIVDGFQARLVVHPDGSTNLEHFLGTLLREDTHGPARRPPGGDGRGPEGRPADRPPADAPRRPRLELPRDFRLDVLLRNGSALLVDEKLGVTTGVETLEIRVGNAGPGEPLSLRLTGDLVLGEERSPIRVAGTALGERDGPWQLAVQAQGMRPGSLTAPLLAASFPLLAGSGDGEPPRVDAPLDLELLLGGPSLAETLAGSLDEIAGSASVGIGRGTVTGGLWSELQQAVDAIRQREGGGLLAEGLPDLELGGFDGEVSVAGGRIRIEKATLAGRDGSSRPLPLEGHATLDGTLHYRIPWAGLVHGKSAALFGERALSIEGPWQAPRFELGLEGLLDEALRGELQRRLDEKLGVQPGEAGDLEERLEQAAEEKLGELLRKKLGKKP